MGPLERFQRANGPRLAIPSGTLPESLTSVKLKVGKVGVGLIGLLWQAESDKTGWCVMRQLADLEKWIDHCWLHLTLNTWRCVMASCPCWRTSLYSLHSGPEAWLRPG